MLLGDPGAGVPVGEAAAGWAGYAVGGDDCGVQAEIARRDIPNRHNRFIWSSLESVRTIVRTGSYGPDEARPPAETKPSVSSPTMQKLEKISRGGESHSRGALESGRWGLAKCRPICTGEAPQLRETEPVGNFPDLDLVRIGVA